MMGTADSRGMTMTLGVAVLLMAGSGCATMSNAADMGYEHNMAAAELALQGDDAFSAIQSYRRAAEAAPALILPWLKIAETEAGQGDWPQALAASQEVLNRDPANEAARGYYLDGSLQLALDAMSYLPDGKLDPGDPVHELATDVLAKLVQTLGDAAIPADARTRLERKIESRLRRSGPRAAPARAAAPQSMPKAAEKVSADPLDILGGG